MLPVARRSGHSTRLDSKQLTSVHPGACYDFFKVASTNGGDNVACSTTKFGWCLNWIEIIC